MTPPHPPTAEPSRPGRRPLIVALAVTFLLATFGGFGASFGGMTACTNEYRCTVTACTPCATAGDWFLAGWAAQALLLLVAGTLMMLAARHVRPRAVRIAALWLTPISLALFVVTTAVAHRSF